MVREVRSRSVGCPTGRCTPSRCEGAAGRRCGAGHGQGPLLPPLSSKLCSQCLHSMPGCLWLVSAQQEAFSAVVHCRQQHAGIVATCTGAVPLPNGVVQLRRQQRALRQLHRPPIAPAQLAQLVHRLLQHALVALAQTACHHLRAGGRGVEGGSRRCRVSKAKGWVKGNFHFACTYCRYCKRTADRIFQERQGDAPRPAPKTQQRHLPRRSALAHPTCWQAVMKRCLSADVAASSGMPASASPTHCSPF